jgi:hypothetical protein
MAGVTAPGAGGPPKVGRRKFIYEGAPRGVCWGREPPSARFAARGSSLTVGAAWLCGALTTPPRAPPTAAGREIYEWEQSLDEVRVYIKPPPGVKASHIAAQITPTHLKLGIKGNPPFIDVRQLAYSFAPARPRV